MTQSLTLGNSVLHSFVIFIRRYLNRLIPIPLPILLAGEGKLTNTAEKLQQHCAKKVLIVSDKTLTELGLCQQLMTHLQASNIDYVLFDEVKPDPTVAVVEQGVTQYQKHGCDSIIAMGGGSVIDCAKGIAACVVKNKPIKALAGLFKICRALPTFIAIPTTAGTGSEATVVAVISDPENKQKFTVIDPYLVPKYAIIDPLLMIGLPSHITAQTGIDALTHALESYIGLHSTSQTKAYSLDAIERIFNYLPQAYANGADLQARTEMSLASYYAGLAFTRTSIGYVHAIAHQLGGYYHIPHGLANAVLLPHVLDFSFDAAYKTYAEIAYHTKVAEQGDNEKQAAKKLVTHVKNLLNTLAVQQRFPELKVTDIPLLAKRAIKEAYCDYPVPKQMTVAECENILAKLLVNNT